MVVIYFVTIILFTLLSAYIDSRIIKSGNKINHFLHSSLYVFFCVALAFLLRDNANYILWGIYCTITCLLIRAGWFDFALNIFRGLDWYYVSREADGVWKSANESLYDDLLAKFNANPNDVRILTFLFSIIWFFTINFFLNGC